MVGPRLGIGVSIHAPHARGDHAREHDGHAHLVSIHAPHARGDVAVSSKDDHLDRFNPRPSCEGRLQARVDRRRGREVSIHAPHARGDLANAVRDGQKRKFQSTPLMRGATGWRHDAEFRVPVSIHAPHARGDRRDGCRDVGAASFNPRPSCEGRPAKAFAVLTSGRFQSTPLMRGATKVYDLSAEEIDVSIHAPHARGDS